MKITPRELDKYLKKSPRRPLEPLEPRPAFRRLVVIPVMDELRELPGTLNSLDAALRRRASSGSGVVLVINHAPDAPEETKAADLTLLKRLRMSDPATLGGLVPGETLFWADAASPGNEILGGVGEARRIGLDVALTLMESAASEDSFLFSLDADSPVAPEYLRRVEECFRANPSAGAVSVAFRHRPGKTADEERAVRAYERYMDGYVARLKAAGSPYAFHAVGSAFAVRAPVYVAAGGMRVRRAAEDFYFLQAVRKISEVAECPEPLVFPSARTSGRVPFGTGPAIRRQLEGSPLPEYADAGFAELKTLMETADDGSLRDPDRFESMLTEPARRFLRRRGFFSAWPSVVRNVSGRRGAAREAFDRWFDGLKTLQFLKTFTDAPAGCPGGAGNFSKKP